MADERSRRRTILAVAALVAISAAGVAIALRPKGGEDSGPIRPLAGREGEDRLTGDVTENDLGCRLNGPCFLRLSGQPPELRIVYHYGESPPCRNSAVADAAQALRVGERVAVFGRYQDLGGQTVLSTCDSTRYTIRAVG